MTVTIAVTGAAGRMGRRIIALSTTDEQVRCAAALEGPGSKALGADAGELAGVDSLGVVVADRLDADVDVVVDFSTPTGSMHWLGVCTEHRLPFITGTTGFTDEHRGRLRDASADIPVIVGANMSVGVNLMLRLVRQVAGLLDASYDVEIVEAHHRHKVDAPSGTALALRDAVVEGRSGDGGKEPSVVYGRHGAVGPRPAGEIALHTLRTGDVVGEHTVSFGGLGETITIGHAARSRDIFAAGALRAARWIVGRPPGLYDMQDVLFKDRPAPPV